MYLNCLVILFFGFTVVGSNRFGGAAFSQRDSPVIISNVLQPRWFNQKLDHTKTSDNRSWKQRYFVNDTFYDSKKKGPIFLMLEGESQASPRWPVNGTWVRYAKKFNALCYYLEHRFYGLSQPTSDLSLQNIRYLTSQQALGDAANFITQMNKEQKWDPKTTKWFIFGGSYAGALSAWMRVKYPNLVYASVSSSAPLKATFNFKEYLQVVVNALTVKTGNAVCRNKLITAHNQLVALTEKSPEVVSKDFKVCKPIAKSDKDDINLFYNTIADSFAGLVQYNEGGTLSGNTFYSNYTINVVCNFFTKGKNPYQSLVKFNQFTLDADQDPCLKNDYTKFIDDMKNTTISSLPNRQWLYQTCNEFGYFQTSDNVVPLFGKYFPLEFFIKMCKEAFGSKYTKQLIGAGVKTTNNYYGGLDIKTDRIIFVHGSIDPWHVLGITNSTNPKSPSILINGSAHCADMFPQGKHDSKELIAARARIESYLGKWLNDTE